MERPVIFHADSGRLEARPLQQARMPAATMFDRDFQAHPVTPTRIPAHLYTAPDYKPAGRGVYATSSSEGRRTIAPNISPGRRNGLKAARRGQCPDAPYGFRNAADPHSGLLSAIAFRTGPLNSQEKFPSVHPVKNQPETKHCRHAHQERFAGVPQHIENTRAKIGHQVLFNEVLEQMGDAVCGDRVHADDRQWKRQPAVGFLFLKS